MPGLELLILHGDMPLMSTFTWDSSDVRVEFSWSQSFTCISWTFTHLLVPNSHLHSPRGFFHLVVLSNCSCFTEVLFCSSTYFYCIWNLFHPLFNFIPFLSPLLGLQHNSPSWSLQLHQNVGQWIQWSRRRLLQWSSNWVEHASKRAQTWDLRTPREQQEAIGSSGNPLPPLPVDQRFVI